MWVGHIPFLKILSQKNSFNVSTVVVVAWRTAPSWIQQPVFVEVRKGPELRKYELICFSDGATRWGITFLLVGLYSFK
jgi:hypothetical protein